MSSLRWAVVAWLCVERNGEAAELARAAILQSAHVEPVDELKAESFVERLALRSFDLVLVIGGSSCQSDTARSPGKTDLSDLSSQQALLYDLVAGLKGLPQSERNRQTVLGLVCLVVGW